MKEVNIMPVSNPGKNSFDKMRVDLWVSGTCGQDGSGGYCAILQSVVDGKTYKKTIAGYGISTTATRMTLKAVNEALQLLKHKCFVHIYTGVPQVSRALNKTIYEWASNDFVRKNGDDLKHEDLYRQIFNVLQTNSISHKVHYLKQSPIPDNNLFVIHTASEYVRKARTSILEVSIS